MLCSGERCIELANCKLSRPKSLRSGLHMWWEPVEHQSAKGIQIIAQIMVKGINESFPHPCIIWMEGWKQPPSWNMRPWFHRPFLSLLHVLLKNNLRRCNKHCNRVTDMFPLLSVFIHCFASSSEPRCGAWRTNVHHPLHPLGSACWLLGCQTQLWVSYFKMTC